MITDKQYDLLAQYNHAMLGGLFILIPFILIGQTSVHYAAPLGAAYAAIKEFWYDQNFESKEVRGSNMKDFVFYLLGIAIGIIIVNLKTLF